MAQTPTERVAANVRAELARAQQSGRGLAGQIGMAPSSMARRLSGSIPFRVDELHRIADALNVAVSVLMADGPTAVSA